MKEMKEMKRNESANKMFTAAVKKLLTGAE
jgi:hypothetical protein